MHFWRGGEVPWLSFGTFTVNKSCNWDIFHTCDNEQSSALACHFQVFSSFKTDTHTYKERKGKKD